MFAAMQDENAYKVAIEIMDKAASTSLKDPSGAPLANDAKASEKESREESEDMQKILKGPFFAVGSWNDWANFEELLPGTGDDESKFSGRIKVPRGTGQRREEFQIVYNRDWTKRFHPAGGGKIEGPDNMHAVNWQVLVPLDCVSLRIIWDPRGGRSCEWRFLNASGEEQKPLAPAAASGGSNKFGAGVQKLLKQDSKPENKLSFGAQQLLGNPSRPLLKPGLQNGQEDLQRRNMAASGPLKSSLSESDDAVVKIEAAEQRRAMLLGAPQLKPTHNILNSSLTETIAEQREKEAIAEQRRANLLSPAPAPPPAPANPSWSQPDQELRKAQMKAATNQDLLNGILKVVRSDWSAIERQAVLRKLSRIGVGSPAELYTKLEENGEAGINSLLKDAGQKPLREDTLKAMHDHCRQTMPS
jgi:hypothetical protein